MSFCEVIFWYIPYCYWGGCICALADMQARPSPKHTSISEKSRRSGSLEFEPMNKTILVTGPELDPSAAKLVAEQGYETVHTPPYADSAVISET